MKVSILVASQGKNKELANTLNSIVEKNGATSQLIDLVELELPLYSQITEEGGVPEKAQELNKMIKESDALIFLAPEYNGGLPPVLTNAIAWVSRDGKSWRESFNSKPALIGTHSGSGGVRALVQLREQLSYIGLNVLGRVIHTHFSKPLNEESAQACVEGLLKQI
jgi:chromate reductase